MPASPERLPPPPPPGSRRGLSPAMSMLGLVVIAALAAWLSLSRPALWLALLNRQLPANLEIVAVQGLRPGLSGVAWRRIELTWSGHSLTLGHGHLEWDLQQLWPLKGQLLHVEAAHLGAVLGPGEGAPSARWEPLPRFWEESWWPLLENLSGDLQGFDVLSNGGETLLSGRVHWQSGARSGELNAFLADTEITLRWADNPRKEKGPGWAATWHSHGSPLGPLHAEGEVELYWTEKRLAFGMQGNLNGELITPVSSDGLSVNAEGYLALFDGSDLVVDGSWSLHGLYGQLQELPIAWECQGRVGLATTVTPLLQVNRCDGVSAAGSAELTGPVALDWTPLALRWEQPVELSVFGASGKGTMQVDAGACVLSAACTSTLELTVEQGSWKAFSWEDAAATARLHRSAANTLRVTDLNVDLTRLRRDGLTVSDLQLAAPEITLWPRDPEGWQIRQLDTSARVELTAAELVLAVRTSLTDAQFAAPSRWHTQAATTLAPTWHQRPLPTYYLDHRVQQTSTGLEARGTLSTETLDSILRHSFTIADDNSPRFTAQLDSTQWPDRTQQGTDMIAALLGDDVDRLPIPLPLRTLYGDVRADLSGCWCDAELQLDATARGDRLTGLLSEYAFAGVTVAPFELRWNSQGFSTAAPVSWQVAEFNIGVVLADVGGQLSLERNAWQVTEVAGELLGGRFQLDTFSATDGGTLRLDQVDLAAAVALMNQPDIQVTGKVNGRLPVALEGRAPVIRGGTVRNDGAGVIRYRPAPDSDFLRNNPQTAVVSDVLKNFHYQRLEADVTYRANGDLLLGTRLEGRNPDLEGSPPIHLNLNVEQNLPSLMRSLRAGDDISAWLERRVK